MITVQDVVKELCKMGLTGVTLEYDSEKSMLAYGLNTGAKSGLRMLEDFSVTGRYGYTNQLDNSIPLHSIIRDLYWEFENCLHGRDYFNYEWREIGVQLGIIEKKVETHTTTTYV